MRVTVEHEDPLDIPISDLADGQLAVLTEPIGNRYVGRVIEMKKQGYSLCEDTVFVVGECNGESWTNPAHAWKNHRCRPLKPGTTLKLE